ncbi:hypothetical protein [Chitinophaga sp. S165]|uniref:hypothetical protein n=1 Tax=Chitinophaga sp. S165 TaxID=2135462 RepID=UPI000D714156|nr:hypothetical protein [Chitinophaga sp. S165]PWV51641.1 hypothetical protein C7475_103251 [Chitinophaga sp. S165]
MENVASKRTRKSLRKADIIVPREPGMTLEELFVRQKHEDAVATLPKYPVPEELLQRLRNTARY